MSTGLLTGKTAVITGATSGVGRASALLFAREGAAVVATGRRESHLTALRQEIEAEGGRCVTCAGDIADLGLGDELVRLALKETGRVDILLYSAGMALRSSTLDMTPDEVKDNLGFLKSKKTIINLEASSPEEAERALDMLRGI